MERDPEIVCRYAGLVIFNFRAQARGHLNNATMGNPSGAANLAHSRRIGQETLRPHTPSAHNARRGCLPNPAVRTIATVIYEIAELSIFRVQGLLVERDEAIRQRLQLRRPNRVIPGQRASSSPAD